MTEDECVENGGHCYVVSPIVMTSNPPQYSRTCKHCDKHQRGVDQPSRSWRDA